MCTASSIGDYGRKMWPSPLPDPYDGWKPFPVFPITPAPYSWPTKEQFEEFLKLMRAAREFDKATGQADCPSEEKTGWIKSTAKVLGIDESKLTEIFK